MDCTKLAKAFHETGGFEFWHHAGNREELNDHVEKKCADPYVRAVQGLRNYENAGYGSPLGRRILDYCGDIPGVYHTGFYRGAPDTVVVTYGTLRRQLVREIARPPRSARVKKGGIAGLFGATHEVLLSQDPEIEIDYAEIPLCDIACSDLRDPAWFAVLPINAYVPEAFANPRPSSLPALTVVANEGLVKNLLTFTEQNPAEYQALIRALVPRENFPHVNKGIIDKAERLRNIIFMSSSKLKELIKTRELDYMSDYEERLKHYRKYKTSEVSVE